MKQITLGKTNVKTLNLGFGGIPLQRASQTEAEQVIAYCLSKGVNFFDSARAYTVSERLIGNSLKSLKRRRQDVYLASKAMPLTAAQMLEQMQISLTELGTDYIDLYQSHNIKSTADMDTIFSADGAYQAFKKLNAEGKILHFGLTSHKREVLDYALSKYADKIETIMFPYNIVENQGEQLFKKAKQLNVGTIAMKPLAGGNLTDVSLALRYCLNNGFIDIAIPGIGSLAEAQQDLSVKLAPLAKSELDLCRKLAGELGDSFCRRCGYCAPCPAGLDIAGIFTMQTYANIYNLKEWAKSRYDAMPKHTEDCTKCGACQKRCPYNLKIIERLQEAGKDLK